MLSRVRLVPSLIVSAVAMFLSVSAEAQSIELKNAKWTMNGDDTALVEFDGRDAVYIKTGVARLEEIALENGTIEFDMYLSGERSFVYLLFRGQTDSDYEDFYVRPHKSDLPDALQYAPVFQRRSAWQLYHGPAGTAAAPLPPRQWIPVRIELSGPKATFWIGESDNPVMVIPRLGREPASGWLAFRGFVPANSSAPFAAYFSNLTVQPANASAPAQETEPFPEGQLTQWRVSPAFVPAEDTLSLPDALTPPDDWQRLRAEPSGVIEFLRWRPIPADAPSWAVAADLTLVAESAQRCAVDFGFSDTLSLIVNGQPLVYQDHSFRFDGPRRQGVLYADQLRAYLPLKAGDNHVRAIVADRFGGWGLSARLVGCRGVSAR